LPTIIEPAKLAHTLLPVKPNSQDEEMPLEMLVSDKRRDQKAERKQEASSDQSHSSRLDAKAKFIITRHRALYSNMSELKEFLSFKIGGSKR